METENTVTDLFSRCCTLWHTAVVARTTVFPSLKLFFVHLHVIIMILGTYNTNKLEQQN